MTLLGYPRSMSPFDRSLILLLIGLLFSAAGSVILWGINVDGRLEHTITRQDIVLQEMVDHEQRLRQLEQWQRAVNAPKNDPRFAPSK